MASSGALVGRHIAMQPAAREGNDMADKLFYAGCAGCASAFQKSRSSRSLGGRSRPGVSAIARGTDQGQTITLAFVQLSRNLALASAKVGVGSSKCVSSDPLQIRSNRPGNETLSKSLLETTASTSNARLQNSTASG